LAHAKVPARLAMSALRSKADTGRSAALGGRGDRRFRTTPCEHVDALKLYQGPL